MAHTSDYSSEKKAHPSGEEGLREPWLVYQRLDAAHLLSAPYTAAPVKGWGGRGGRRAPLPPTGETNQASGLTHSDMTMYVWPWLFGGLAA